MEQLENQFNTDFNRTLDTTFADPRYRTRYNQLNFQYLGFYGFNNPVIQHRLNLTPEQLVQIRQLVNDWRKQVTQYRDVNAIDRRQWSQVYAQYWDQINTILTPEQQRLWLQLIGQRYVFPPNVYYPLTTEHVNGRNIDGSTTNSERTTSNGLRSTNSTEGTVEEPVQSNTNQPAPQDANANAATRKLRGNRQAFA